jgi:methionyl-tRNA formyltransferase
MGDPIAGGTVYSMDDGADTGSIAAQDWCFVRPDDDARSLWRRELAPMGIKLFEKVLNHLGSGFVVSSPQQSYAATWEPSFTSSKLSKA